MHILSLRGYPHFNTNPGSHFLLMEIDSIILAVYNQRYGSGDGGSLAVLLFMGGGDLLYTSYLGLPGWIPLGALCLWIIFSGQLKPARSDLANHTEASLS